MNAISRLENQFLRTSGWSRSIECQSAVDNAGPVPWFTYPAIRCLKGIVCPHWRVLEYGSGNSTRWWSARVAEVVSVEHDPAWVASLKEDLPANVTLIERVMDEAVPPASDELLRTEYFRSGCNGSPTPDPTRNYRAGLLDAAYRAYACVGLEYPQHHFDVVIVDGMARALTAWVAARQVALHGFIVFDNSDREEYSQAYRYLERSGFVRLDFWGLGPINPYEWCTTIFTRTLDPFRKHPA